MSEIHRKDDKKVSIQLYPSAVKWVRMGLEEGLDEEDDDAAMKLEKVPKDIEEQDIKDADEEVKKELRWLKL